MADVKITAEIDLLNLPELKRQLEDLWKGPSSSPSSSSNAPSSMPARTKEADAFAEALARIKTEARDVETQFRRLAIEERKLAKEVQQGTGSLDALRKAQEATKNAQQQAISVIAAQESRLKDLGDESGRTAVQLDKISIATKSMVEAQQRVRVGFVGMATALDDINSSTKAANNVLLEFSRGVGDAGMFALDARMGFIAIGNNITQTAESMGRMVSQARMQAEALRNAGQAATTAGVAFRSLGASFLGVNGIIFAINAAVSALTIWSQTAKEAEQATNPFIGAAEKLANEFERINKAITDARQKLGQVGGGDIEQTQDQIERLTGAIEKLSQKQVELATSRDGFLGPGGTVIAGGGMTKEERQAIVDNLNAQISSNGMIVGQMRNQRDDLLQRLDAQIKIKALLGDEIKVIEQAKNSGKESAKLKKNEYDMDAAISKLRQDMYKVDSDRADKLREQYEEAVKQLKLEEEIARKIQVREQAAAASLRDRQFNKALEKAPTFEAAKKLIDQNFDTQMRQLQMQYDAGIIYHTEFLDKKFELEVKYEDDITALRIRSMERARDIANQYFSAVNDLAQFATNVGLVSAKQAFNIQKGAAAAETTVNTYATVQKIMAQGGLYATPMAIAAGIAGFARVAAILSTPFEGKGGRSQTGRTAADGGGGFSEGFRTDTLRQVGQTGGTQALREGGVGKTVPIINIYSSLNEEAQAYSVRRGEAIIRQNTTIMQSD